jgi:hypothetical protein
LRPVAHDIAAVVVRIIGQVEHEAGTSASTRTITTIVRGSTTTSRSQGKGIFGVPVKCVGISIPTDVDAFDVGPNKAINNRANETNQESKYHETRNGNRAFVKKIIELDEGKMVRDGKKTYLLSKTKAKMPQMMHDKPAQNAPP